MEDHLISDRRYDHPWVDGPARPTAKYGKGTGLGLAAIIHLRGKRCTPDGLSERRVAGRSLAVGGDLEGIVHFAGTVAGAPFCFTKNTRNLAGFVALAFREMA